MPAAPIEGRDQANVGRQKGRGMLRIVGVGHARL